MTKEEEKRLMKNLNVSSEEFERLKSEDIDLEEMIEKERPDFISTNSPIPPKEKSKIITTHDLNADGKLIPEQRYWDKAKTMRKPQFVTSDIGEDVDEKKRRDEIMADVKKSKEKK